MKKAFILKNDRHPALCIYRERDVKKERKKNMNDYSVTAYKKIKAYLDKLGCVYCSYDDEGLIRFKSDKNVFNVYVKKSDFIVLIHFGKVAYESENTYKLINDINFTLTVGNFLTGNGELYFRYPVIFEGLGEELSENIISRSLLTSEAIVKKERFLFEFSKEIPLYSTKTSSHGDMIS